MRRTATLALVVLAALEGSARADDAAAPPAARALYEEATQAMDKKDFASACPKLEEVVRLVPEGVGARLTLGECYEAAGKLASAWEAFNQASAAASKAGQRARVDKATAAANALRPRLATLSIDVAPGVRGLAGLAVERDGKAVEPSDFGVAIPVDRGPHQITARAPSRIAFEKSADVAADGATVKVRLDALSPLPDLAVVTPVAPPPVEVPTREHALSPLVYVGFGAAAVGIGVGAVTGAMTLSKASTCKSGSGCSSSSLDGAKTTAWVSDIAFGVGAAGAAVGVIALVTSRHAKPMGPASAVVRIAPRSVRIEGTF